MARSSASFHEDVKVEELIIPMIHIQLFLQDQSHHSNTPKYFAKYSEIILRILLNSRTSAPVHIRVTGKILM